MYASPPVIQILEGVLWIGRHEQCRPPDSPPAPRAWVLPDRDRERTNHTIACKQVRPSRAWNLYFRAKRRQSRRQPERAIRHDEYVSDTSSKSRGSTWYAPEFYRSFGMGKVFSSVYKRVPGLEKATNRQTSRFSKLSSHALF